VTSSLPLYYRLARIHGKIFNIAYVILYPLVPQCHSTETNVLSLSLSPFIRWFIFVDKYLYISSLSYLVAFTYISLNLCLISSKLEKIVLTQQAGTVKIIQSAKVQQLSLSWKDVCVSWYYIKDVNVRQKFIAIAIALLMARCKV